MTRIGIIFLLFFAVIMLVSVVSAEDNTTTDNTTHPIKASVSTPDLGYVYHKNGKMYITIKEKSTKKPVKHVKINVKVYTNKKFKTYYLKTNSKGIAKLPTKKIKLGSHKFIIRSNNTNYTMFKKDKLFIGYKKSITLKINKQKKLKTGDAISTIVKNKTGSTNGIYTQVWYAGVKSDIEPRHTMILKSKLFFKNKKTGKIKTKIIKGKLFTYNGETYRGLPSTTPIKGYTPYKAKVWFLTSR